jgi:hypothetical protein
MEMKLRRALVLLPVLALVACGGDDDGVTPDPVVGLDPDTAAVASVDRFSDTFGKLFKRSGPAFDPANVQPVIPEPNEPFDMDAMFTVKALGPSGENVTYYALDIVDQAPGKAYVVLGPDGREIAGQLPIVEGLPGDVGYNDFVQITEVTVQAGFVANTITSVEDVTAAVEAGSATMTETTRIENWSMVPKGTMAAKKFAGNAVTGHRAWFKDQVAHFMLFDTELEVTDADTVPTSGIIVIFANDMNPDMGFAHDGTGQTHNSLETVPGDPGYSSYWDHSMGSLTGFDGVTDFASATANISGKLPVIVNCPVVAP